jgi:hypothetical protein
MQDFMSCESRFMFFQLLFYDFLCCQIDIVLSIDGVCILTYVIINPTKVDFIDPFFFRDCNNSCDLHKGWCLLQSISNGLVFKCLHQQEDWFFHDVLTWCKKWKAFEACVFQFCTHFIGKRC